MSLHTCTRVTLSHSNKVMRGGTSVVTAGILLVLCLACCCPGQGWAKKKGPEFGEWSACRASELAGELVSTPAFDPAAHPRACFPVASPTTAFVALLNNGTFNFTDPFYEQQLYWAPDINETGRDFYTFWWRTTLDAASVPSSHAQTLRLHLRGVNYKVRVYADGHLLADDVTGAEIGVGMFRRHTYVLDRTPAGATAGEHILALLVEPPDFPGSCRVPCRGCGQGGSHDLARLTTMQFAAGWDWIRGTPDRNTGLWDKVSLSQTGEVALRDPFCGVDEVQLSGVAGAALAVSARVSPVVSIVRRVPHVLASGGAAVGIEWQAYLLGDPSRRIVCRSSASISMAPSSDSDASEIQLPPCVLESPSLWYPHTHGSPHLYAACFSASVNGTILDSACVHFGVRVIETSILESTGGRRFLVNGVPVFIQGGNWIHTDQFMRYTTDPQRYLSEVRRHKEMGMNFIRVWGGGIAERPEFYDAADELGMLVMQEFWMTGDNNGRWAGSHSWPLDHSVYLDNVRDTILLLRNHPSLMLWCGGNELFPPGKSPPPDIEAAIPQLIESLDQPGRFFIPSSMSNYTNYDPGFALAPKDGPYGILLPEEFFVRNPGLTFWNGTRADSLALSFQPEIGSVSTPTVKSLRRFLSPASLSTLPDAETAPDAWNFHNYISYTTPNTSWNPLRRPFDHISSLSGGTSRNVAEYAQAAAVVQMQQYQSLFEGFQQFMWEYYTAVLMWKSQSPWPVLRGAFYDSWMHPTGGYWGVKRALGSSIHIQLNRASLEPTVLNKGPGDFESGQSLVVRSRIFSLAGALLDETNHTFPSPTLKAQSVQKTPRISWPRSRSQPCVLIVDLQLLIGVRKLVSNNRYFLSNPSVMPPDYGELADLRRQPSTFVHLTASLTQPGRGELFDVHLRLDPDADAAAMFVELEVTRAESPLTDCIADTSASSEDDRVPLTWLSDNLFIVLPGEARTVSLEFPDTVGSRACLQIGGWNVVPQAIPVTWMD